MEWILSESLPKLAEPAVTLEGRESVGRGAKLTGVAACEKISVPITTTDIGCRTGLHINPYNDSQIVVVFISKIPWFPQSCPTPLFHWDLVTSRPKKHNVSNSNGHRGIEPVSERYG